MERHPVIPKRLGIWVLAGLALGSCHLLLGTDNNRYGTSGSGATGGTSGQGGEGASGGGPHAGGGGESTGGTSTTGTGSGGYPPVDLCGALPAGDGGAADCGTGGLEGFGGSCGSMAGGAGPGCQLFDPSANFDDFCGAGCATETCGEDWSPNAEGRWGLKYRDECTRIALCNDGSLQITPEDGEYWYRNGLGMDKAALVYRRLCGPFAMAFEVAVETSGSGQEYSGAGLIVQHPAKANPWLMLSTGNQAFGGGGGESSAAQETILYFDDGLGEETVRSAPGLPWNGEPVVHGVCRNAARDLAFVRRQSTGSAEVLEIENEPVTYGLVDSCCLDVGMTAHEFSAPTDNPTQIFRWVEISGEQGDFIDCSTFVESQATKHGL
ncbi:MAG: hypothetical protein R3B72_40930 [Polyangiaceae bacterium]